ncbi:MAG: ComF family protein [Gammaproteobacteria bacterium]|nr:MAG: ComF family protein [Gammaproteobacteria bacterium]
MRWEKFIFHYARFIYDQLLPPVCILCSHPTARSTNICFTCQQSLPILPDHCLQCAQFFSGMEKTPLCHTCHHQPPPFDRTFALFPYQSPITQLIIQLKFQHRLPIAKSFADLLIQRLQTTWYRRQKLPDLIIPMPLHPHRLRERGFNQAVEIAKPVAKKLGIPLDLHGIKRTKHTQAQSALPALERKRNITNAFTAYRDYSGLTLAVVDDVVTTGQTMAECCHVLKQHGARQIDVWCCARRG